VDFSFTLTRLVSRELVYEVVASAGRKEIRRNKLPARVMVYFVMTMALFTATLTRRSCASSPRGWIYRAASLRLPCLADAGYQGAGIGIRIPVKIPSAARTSPSDRSRNPLLCSLRCQRLPGSAECFRLAQCRML
jgi:hypothetical protein